MGEAQNNKPELHRKEWQTMMPAPTTTAAGGFIVKGNGNVSRFVMYIASATVHYLYDHRNDDWIQIASGALSPAFGAGACGVYTAWSGTFTANGGSTTTVSVNAATHALNGFAVGQTIEFLSGTAANIGLRRTILSMTSPNLATGNIILTLDSAVTSVANNDTFRINSGRFWILEATGTLVAASYRVYDVCAGTWTSREITGLPAAPGTDGKLWTPGTFGVSYDTGTAAATSSTTALDCTGKTWTADQWINYQVRITGGTGQGQVKVITDNDTDTLTFTAGTDLDATSTFVIEGDENAIYYLGNGAITMYKYSISGNSWATLAPTANRAAAPSTGATAEFVGQTGVASWANVSDIKDGRYMYSFRGGGSGVVDRYDISGGTNGAGTWIACAYHPFITTFTTGTGSDWDNEHIYLVKEGTAAIPQRVFAYNVVSNEIHPVTTDWYLGGAALIGNKAWIHQLSSAGLIKWLYVLQSTSTVLRRIMIY